MPNIDLCFTISGSALPIDHGYALYSAVSRVLGPDTHGANGMGIHPIRGEPMGNACLCLGERSRLRIRTPVDSIPPLLKLSGKTLDVDGHVIRLGVPQTYALEPAAALSSRLVTIKGFEKPAPFLEAVQRQLDTLGIAGHPAIPLRTTEAHQGEPTRRVLKIKDKTVVGFALIVSELTAGESLTLQEKGIGGRRHMGCGVFAPFRSE